MLQKKVTGEVLTVIPARGGSKGIPRKNLALIGGKPMIEFTFRAALKANLPGRICLTTDDEEIRAFGLTFPGIESPFLRPVRLATDRIGTLPVIEHALDWYKGKEKFTPDVIVLLQPTCPFRTSQNIREAYALLLRTKAASLISVNPVKEHPCEYVKEEENKFSYVMKPPEKPGRQNFPKIYFINGAIYIVRTDYFLKTGKLYDNHGVLYKMKREESLDIDDLIDLTYANWFYEHRFANKRPMS